MDKLFADLAMRQLQDRVLVAVPMAASFLEDSAQSLGIQAQGDAGGAPEVKHQAGAVASEAAAAASAAAATAAKSAAAAAARTAAETAAVHSYMKHATRQTMDEQIS